jgi:hypothetical protein
MTNTPNVKPESVSTDAKPAVTTPVHDTPKAAEAPAKVETKVEPKPAVKV